MTFRVTVAAALSLVLLAGCGRDDVILPGERVDIRAQTVPENQIRPVNLPAARVNADWSHRNGSPGHVIVHPALGPTLSPVFVADIGEGNSKAARITSYPVVAGCHL